MQTWLYVGCYTTESTTGIHCFEASAPHRDLEHRWQVDDIEHASFLAVSTEHAAMYAVSETTDDGSVVAYRRTPIDGSLERIDEVPSHGAAPCHVSVDGDHVHVANYGSGTVASYLLDGDGTFAGLAATGRHHGSGPHPRQAEPHAHCILPWGGSVYAADLGTDRIVRYVQPSSGNPVEWPVADETPLPPGAGPRHIAFHPDRPIAYVLCELDSRLVVFEVDESGRLRPRTSVSALPVGFAGESIAAEVAVHPDGHRVYVSNRGDDSIATFAIDDPDDAPVLLEHVPSGGRTPRHFAIHPSGRSMLVANQDSDTLVSFALDGEAIPRRPRPVAEVSQPVCVVFVRGER